MINELNSGMFEKELISQTSRKNLTYIQKSTHIYHSDTHVYSNSFKTNYKYIS